MTNLINKATMKRLIERIISESEKIELGNILPHDFIADCAISENLIEANNSKLNAKKFWALMPEIEKELNKKDIKISC